MFVRVLPYLYDLFICRKKQKDIASMFDASKIDLSGVAENIVAIDFGASNTDAAAVVDGNLRVWNEPRRGMPSIESVHSILEANELSLANTKLIAVTGGHHQLLPAELAGVPIVKIGELVAIG